MPGVPLGRQLRRAFVQCYLHGNKDCRLLGRWAGRLNLPHLVSQASGCAVRECKEWRLTEELSSTMSRGQGHCLVGRI